MGDENMNKRALYSKNGQNWQDGNPLSWTSDKTVVKIVIGDPEGSGESIHLRDKLPDDLANLYPCLTHLYIWGVQLNCELPEMPQGLRCLDIRNVTGLERIKMLPVGLEQLILEKNTALKDIGTNSNCYRNLVELSIQNCVELDSSEINFMLKHCPSLVHLDLSGNDLLETIENCSKVLERVELNGCSNIKKLPDFLSNKLRRIGLRGCKKLTSINELGELNKIKFIDLQETVELRKLPEFVHFPESLFLYESGIRIPPASEHGSRCGENVSENTRLFFKDTKDFGFGEVQRCKLLMLGNGLAGKTLLSQAFINPNKIEKKESTHGVQFFNWKLLRECGHPVNLQIWDFGGQEIYHGTHQLFASKGSVFVVLWNPDKHRKVSSSGIYVDRLYPLVYWMDYIHSFVKHPKVAVVCSGREYLQADTRSKIVEELTSKYKNTPLFAVDNDPVRGSSTGELDKLVEKLHEWVFDLVELEGSHVPSYWDVAQEMVNSLIDKTDTSTTSIQDLTQDAFAEKLTRELNRRKSEFPKLEESIKNGRFRLNEERRLERLLEFLTRSGWLFWDEALFEKRIIVDQQWALIGIYSVLKRNSSVYDFLVEAGGLFAPSDLANLCWTEKGKCLYREDEQKLLLTFMERCKLIFKIHSSEDSFRNETVYVSYEHLLPESKSLRFKSVSNVSEGEFKTYSLRSESIHKGKWQGFLVGIGSQYWNRAEYYRDAVKLTNLNGQLITIRLDLDEKGIGGNFVVSVKQIREPESNQEMQRSSLDVPSRTRQVISWMKGIFDDLEISEELCGDSHQVESFGDELPMGNAPTKINVFVSYSWSFLDENRAVIGEDCKAPVQLISTYLQGKSDIDLIVDYLRIERFDDLTYFMKNAAKSTRVVLVHSNKYLYSICTLFELSNIKHSLSSCIGRSWCSVIVPVGLPSSELLTLRREKYTAFWSEDFESGIKAWKAEREKDYPVSPLHELDTKKFWDWTAQNVDLIDRSEWHSRFDTKNVSLEFVCSINELASAAGTANNNICWDEKKSKTVLDDIYSRLTGR